MSRYKVLLNQKKSEMFAKGFLVDYFEPKSQELQSGVCSGSFIWQQEIIITSVKLDTKPYSIDFDFRELNVNCTTLEEDLKTRDFTVNGLYYDIFEKKVIDLIKGPNQENHQGISDLKSKVIRCINSFESTFMDESRYIRAVRLLITKKFKLEYELEKHIKEKAANNLRNMQPSLLFSVTKEIGKLVDKNEYFVEGMLELLRNCFLLGQPNLTEKDLSESKNNITSS